MKNLLLAGLMALTMASCIGTKARDTALLPAASLAWPAVKANVERGIDDAIEDGDLSDRTVLDAQVALMTAVLDAGADRVQLRSIPWNTTLRPYAERGIQDMVDDGEITQQIADTSFTERLNNFSWAIAQLKLADSRMIVPASSVKERWLERTGRRLTHLTYVHETP